MFAQSTAVLGSPGLNTSSACSYFCHTLCKLAHFLCVGTPFTHCGQKHIHNGILSINVCESTLQNLTCAPQIVYCVSFPSIHATPRHPCQPRGGEPCKCLTPCLIPVTLAPPTLTCTDTPSDQQGQTKFCLTLLINIIYSRLTYTFSSLSLGANVEVLLLSQVKLVIQSRIQVANCLSQLVGG